MEGYAGTVWPFSRNWGVSTPTGVRLRSELENHRSGHFAELWFLVQVVACAFPAKLKTDISHRSHHDR